MLNSKRREKREKLQAQKSSLHEELDFAMKQCAPWGYRDYESGEVLATTCDRHGDYERFTLVGKEFRGKQDVKYSRCPGCLRAELDLVDAELRSLCVASLLDDAGIARRFESCELENYQAVNQDAARNLAACQRYANTWQERLAAGTSMIMIGNCGTGKNHLAVSMVKSIIRNHLATVEITDVMRLTRAVKNAWRHGSELSEDDVIAHFVSLDLLIIDEVGVQFGTPTEATILQEVINARYEGVLPTILISNLTFEQLKESIGERIVDRVTDGGRNRLTFGWESYRANAGGVTA